MKAETLIALKASIEHWKRVVTSPETEPINSKSCALCQIFLVPSRHKEVTDCIGCPVFEKTGKQYCRGTPYQDVYEASKRGDDNEKAYNEAAKEELEFLQSLLPDDSEQTTKQTYDTDRNATI